MCWLEALKGDRPSPGKEACYDQTGWFFFWQEEQLKKQKEEEQQRLEREASRREKARQEEQLKQIQTKQIKDRLSQIAQTSYGQKMMEKFDEEVSVVQTLFNYISRYDKIIQSPPLI